VTESARSFSYRALDAEGATRSGQVSAADESSALRELIHRGLTPLQIDAVGRPAAVARSAAGRARVTLVDRITLVQELATLLGAGISLSEALPSLVTAYADQSLGAGLARVDRDVRGGQRLSVAMAQSGLALPPYVLALVQAGEASGELASALADAAAQMEHERRIGQELRNALIYPAVLVLSGIVAVLVIFIGVVPRFASLLKSSRAEVPALSRWIIETGLYVKQHLLGFGLGASALLLLLGFALASAAWRARALEGATRLPLLGPWLLRVDIGRWATVLGTLLANRVPIIEAIGLSSGALRIGRLRHDLAGTARELERGRTLADVLAAQGWFPAARLNLIRVGERSGELPRMLATLGAMETEAARTLQKRVLALIEPAAILIIGAVIGVIMVAVMMAITSLNTVAL
jgi:general secretion pathway protein F